MRIKNDVFFLFLVIKHCNKKQIHSLVIMFVLCLQLNQKLRESTEEEEPPKTNNCTDLQPVQETVKADTHTHTHELTRLMFCYEAYVSHCSVAAASNTDLAFLLCFLPPVCLCHL